MSSRGDTYADETYLDETERGTRDDDRHEGREQERRFPYLPSWGWGGAWGLAPWASRRREADDRRYDERAHDEPGYDPYGEAEADRPGGVARLWDEGLITLLIVGGAILFLFPEPATSGLGVVLMAAGALAWLVDWAT